MTAVAAATMAAGGRARVPRVVLARRRRRRPRHTRVLVQAPACTVGPAFFRRSEEHTSELQSHSDLVCRLLLEKKNNSRSLAAKGSIDFISDAHATSTTSPI